MATPDRDPVYTNDGTTRTTYSRESNATGWFVGIIVALALLAIAYLVFSANSTPSTTVDVNNTPSVTTPAPAPMTEAPAIDTAPAPMTEAPAVDAAPATQAPATPAPATPTPAPATEAPAPATGG